MKKYVIGDIHGQWEKLESLLNLIKFDFDNDKLITLGDYCDGRKLAQNTHSLYNVIEILNKCKNRISLLGNHDDWCLSFLNKKIDESEFQWWLQNGGKITLDELNKLDEKRLNIVKEFYNSLILFYKIEKYIFVHGGFNPKYDISEYEKNSLIWDRNLIDRVCRGYDFSDELGENIVFVGHTCSQYLNGNDLPIITKNVIGLDTGAGYGHKLTIMNLNTKEYWQW